jgi:exodeoxyribonuclease VII large subunit
MIHLEQKIFTVSEITKKLKRTIERNPDFTGVWLKGEIYNLTHHSSGHIYFTLKDDDAVIAVTFFKNANRNLKIKLEEGMSVLVFGSISIFDKRGSYQINISQLKLEGIGELQKRIEQLKSRLLKEGIFDNEKKKQIPFLPKRIGVVTSPTGAAIRDIIKVALRRYPNIEIILAPAKVQGDDAAVTIARGIQELNRPELQIDVIIAGRGGGSFEDLMPFNEEEVVRAFFESSVPIISAVGHEIDKPLSDFSADLAAPTPSAAAEMATPNKKDLYDEINYYFSRMKKALSSYHRECTSKYEMIINKKIFKDPLEIVYNKEMILSDIENRLASQMRDLINNFRNRLLQIPDINLLIKNVINKKSHEYNLLLNTLEQLSPLSVLKRGYSIALDKNKNLVKSIHEIDVNDNLELHLKDGLLNCTVDSKIKEK